MKNFIHKLADVQSSKIGFETKVWQYTIILQNAEIGNNCNINSHCFIENDVTINCGVYIWDGIKIDDHAFIGPKVTFTNDKYPRSKKDFVKFNTHIMKGATIGAGSTILCGINIGEYSMIGAGSLVTKNISPFPLWFGSPAKHVGYITPDGETLDLNMVSKQGVQFKLIDNLIKPV